MAHKTFIQEQLERLRREQNPEPERPRPVLYAPRPEPPRRREEPESERPREEPEQEERGFCEIDFTI